MGILQKYKDANVISTSRKRQHEKMEKVYLRSLRERYSMIHNTKTMKIGLGDAVLIKGEEKTKESGPSG